MLLKVKQQKYSKSQMCIARGDNDDSSFMYTDE